MKALCRTLLLCGVVVLASWTAQAQPASTFISSNSTWKYLDNGSDQGTAWRAPSFNDSAWASGPAPLGYGDASGVFPLTTVSFGPDSLNKYVTTYFRQSFVVTNAAGYTNLLMHFQRDDGVIIYLNGTEVARNYMIPGLVSYNTWAGANGSTPGTAVSDDGALILTTNINPTLLVNGTNAIAAEIHQADPTSSDIWFVMDLIATRPANSPPVVQLTSPTNNASFLAPPSITLSASASDPDGSVTNVDFYVDGAKIGQIATAPYNFNWASPPIGSHTLYAITADDKGATTQSASISITVYDSLGTPLAQITSPTNGAVMQGPTNLTITATASAPGGVTNVQFLANGSLLANDATSPYSIVWSNVPFATNILTAVAFSSSGTRGTSAPISIVVNSPPIDTTPPTIFTQSPLAGSAISNLTSIQVVFSEPVVGVNASDLLVNGVAATSMTGSGSNYTFTVTQPTYGTVNITWASNHGITDLGYPTNNPFNATAPGATWTYNLLDRTPPVITGQTPAAGASVTSLTQVSVTFSELVLGVDASDMLINGSPAIGLTGGGSNYTFSFSQPAGGNVNVTWAASHGITDTASPPNSFNAAAAGATWSYFLDSKTILVESNSVWAYLKAFSEASSPIGLWRQLAFNDSGWSNSPMPFFYGDTGYTNSVNPGTYVGDMLGGSYSSIFFRRKFTINNAAAATNLYLMAQSDDGFIAWINGVEVYRYNMPAGEVPYNGAASSAVNEPNQNGAAYLGPYTLPPPSGYLVDGTNVLDIQGFNNNPTSSSDFGMNAQLFTYLADNSVLPPRIASVSPPAGTVFYLTNIVVTFTEPVRGVNASDLLVNGVPATGVAGGTSNSVYTFTFAQPSFGNVAITWAVGHGITDFDPVPKAFDATAAGSTWQYSLLNPNAPVVAAQIPSAGATVANSLTQISVTFSKSVVGVDAADFLINGVAATGLSGSGANYVFTFAQPAYGAVSVGWIASPGIHDTDLPSNNFDPARAGNFWSYTLLDQTPPAIASQNPPAGAQVTNLTQLTVTFTEQVSGVDASDLLLNGVPATGRTGGPTTYTFTFAQPNATSINVTWAADHGIADLAVTPNPFNATAPGSTWTYLTPDNVPPTVIQTEPPPFATVRTFAQIRVTFSEPVVGVATNSLLVNSKPALQVAGSGAGPYTFGFPTPSNGLVDVRWAAGQTVTDLASPPNAFAGGEWSYTLDPNASLVGKIVFSEIMFDPLGGSPTNEWIELHNISADLVNLTGWYFSRGPSFTFPNVSIPADGYLVVAANVAAFRAKYPAITNVVGGWTGQLPNNGKTLELSTSLDEVVNSVHYATEGDWARRERGSGASAVTSITRSSSTATVTIFAHGYSSGDQVVISGADQPEYNGRFTVNGTSPSTFTITVSGTPVTPATGNIISRWVLDDAYSGWSWFSAASGFGYSLEVLNPAMPNDTGENWLPSLAINGTPGRPNSNNTNNIAPLILDVTHFPPVPTSANPVAITARVSDELSNGVQSVTLFYRDHTSTSPGAFSTAPMRDDGAHSDGLAGDGLYGAILPAMANHTVIEFYVQATDSSGHTRTWPAPALETNGPNATFGTLVQAANALYQVDNEAVPNTMPVIRAVMSGTEAALFPPGNRNSDASFNLTLISTDGSGQKIRYLCDARIRGAGTRGRTPTNNRLNVPNDNSWEGRTALNLNCQFVHAQLIGNIVAAKSGLPAEEPYIVQYRINGVNPAPISAPQNGTGNGAGWGTFLLLRPVDGDQAGDIFPLDSNGNVYRASSGGHNADLSYQGTDPNNYLSRGIYKTSNKTENDWTDLFNLMFAFSQVTPTPDYTQAISTNVNVLEWMRYFAVSSLINDGETKLGNGIGDDYGIYRGQADRRFVIFAHDFDTVFGQGDTGPSYYPINTNSSIYVMLNPPNPNCDVPLLRRFMTNAAFAPVFYSELKRLCDTVFSPQQFNPLVDQYLGSWGGIGPDANTIASIKSYAGSRRAVVLSQIPLAFTAGTTLGSSNGLLYTTTSSVTFFGGANIIDNRRVLVNGSQAIWSAWEGRWTNTVTINPGVNHVLVQSLDSNNVELARTTLDVWYDTGTTPLWAPAGSPYTISANLTIPSGTVLTILPGTTVYVASGVTITASGTGKIIAEGTAGQHIHIGRNPSIAGNWGSLDFINTTVESRLAYIDFDSCGGTTISTHNAQLHVNGGSIVFIDHCIWPSTPVVEYISFDSSSFIVQNCVFPSYPPPTGPESLHGVNGIPGGGYGIFRDNYFGHTWGFNDTIDFTGGNRPGPILQIINNVFDGASDDCLDLDSTDAWIEGNVFMHVHRDPARTDNALDTASAISGGVDFVGQNSDWTIINNIFYDVDHVFLNKGNSTTVGNGGGRVAFLYNTVMHVAKEYSGSTAAEIAAFDWSDDSIVLPDPAIGSGMYAAYNVIYDCPALQRFYNAANLTVIFDHNILTEPWAGPGSGNQVVDPMLNLAALSGTAPTNANLNQVRAAAQLRPGSPAIGAGFGGLNLGALQQHGISIAGEPPAVTAATTATLLLGPDGTFNWGTNAPQRWGWMAYKWKLDNGGWSGEIAVTNNSPFTNPPAIKLAGLAPGRHTVSVVGKNDAGYYQDDPFVYPASAGITGRVSLSRSWVVGPELRLNEILASNNGAVNHNGTTPDVLELFNGGAAPVDLGGFGLTDDISNPAKFVFPLGTSLGAGAYLVVYANNPDATPGLHLGFNLPQSGGALYLFDAVANGGQLLDSVEWGPQLTDLSIGRLADGSWGLTTPTFGAANVAASTGDPNQLRINEWLALEQTPFAADFIELYNGDSRPVNLGGLYLTDAPIGWPTRHQMPALSFIAGNGYLRLVADGDTQAGADHLSFSLASDQGSIALFGPDLSLIDCVAYQPQRINISQGRSPNGGTNIVFFNTPTPGAPNPLFTGPPPNGGILVINEVLASNIGLPELDGRTPDWVELYNGTVSTVNLSDLSLTDDSLQPRRFVFAGGTSLASGAYLRVRCDDGRPPSTNNTGFALKATGGSVYLFDALANGGSLLDAITYGLQTANLSIGRVPNGSTNWVLTSPTPSAANAAVPSLGDPLKLRVNEWMADPGPGKDDWFEIYNSDTLPIPLGGLYLTDDLNNRTKQIIAPLSFIGTATNAFWEFHADGNTGAGADHVNFSLKATGEAVGISDTAGNLIDGYSFGAQVQGVSQGRFPDGSTNVVSFPETDSPGASNYRLLTQVAISEALTHTDLPLEDAIELLNLTAQPIDISGWWLSDDKGTLQKYQIPFPTVLSANGFTVIYETHFTNRLEAAIPFALSSHGDEVVLSAATNNTLTGYRASVKFGAADNAVSFGRYITSDAREEFVATSAHTFGADDPSSVTQFRTGTGAPNAYPRVGPLVISEIMYHPPDIGTNDDVADEFIELHNITTAPVPLYDPAFPTNTWHLRNAVDFDFPQGTNIAAGDYLLVVSFDPINNPGALAAFRTHYGLAPGNPIIIGPYSGKLANDNDQIELRKPGTPDTNGVDYILVEQVHYFDSAPWPYLADGSGFSLQRVSATGFGNDPTNWVAAAPTPGPQSASLDTDGDGMPDSWEIAYGLDPRNALDAGYDADGDGLTNLQEYQMGTNPRDAHSGLQFTSIAQGGANVLLTFNAVSNFNYSIEYSDLLIGNSWHTFQTISAVQTNRVLQFTAPVSAAAHRFYRLITPAVAPH